MSRFSYLLRGAIGLGAIVGIAACGDSDGKLLVPNNPAGGDLTRSYVALGNSITAGWQSGGINDSTQRASYANLFALQAGTRFSYPSFVKPGCPVVLGNWASQKNIDSLAPVPGGCALRDATKATDVLNNVAVPFSYGSDLNVTGPALKFPQVPQTFILGGKSQIDRALVAEPTFVSVWVGNNEALLPATVGILVGFAGNTPPIPPLVTGTEFAAGFNPAIDSLVRARPGLRGILIGATRVTNTPRFFAAESLSTPAKKTSFESFHGRGVTTIIGCSPAGITGWLVSAELAKAIRGGTHPNVVSCIKNVPAAPVGDIFMIDPAELVALNAATDAYNVTIQAKATQLDWAYLDPNPILAAQKTGATPAIPAFPSFTSNTRDAATAPFGALFSLDGVHPSAAGHKIVANAMIDAVNAKYGTLIPRVP